MNILLLHHACHCGTGHVEYGVAYLGGLILYYGVKKGILKF